MRREKRSNPVRCSFTLVEMLTVVVIIALILGMAIPSFTGMWEESKLAGALTTLHGVLGTTRARATRTTERGLFFCIDPVTHCQKIMPIVPDPPGSHNEDYEDCAGKISDSIRDCITDPMAENRFRIVEGDVFEFPVPIRVAPRDIVDKTAWAEEDIARNLFNQPLSNHWPRHRNFFVIIFGPDGRLLVGRDVIIHDIALGIPSSPGQKFTTGYRTGLPVGDPTHYYTNNPANGGETLELDTEGSQSLYDIIGEVDNSGTELSNAINFPSVDGLLVYDESILADVPYEEGQTFKRECILEHGTPIYISRLTGEVLEGPTGENQ